MNIDLTKLSTPVLKEIRKILVAGAEATAERKYANADGAKALDKLKRQNAALIKEKNYRGIVESYDLEFDDPEYFLELTESQLHFVCGKLADMKKEAALATATKNSMKIPPLVGVIDLDPVAIVREGFRNRRNGGSGEVE